MLLALAEVNFMKRVRETSSLKLLPLSVLLIVVVLMACGSDDSVVSSGDGDGDMPKVIRLIPFRNHIYCRRPQSYRVEASERPFL
ncbi:MAG: hypothetical protein CM1200mP39_04640 [Dehalococcoidia bacterium]|nr:MAG: hypothetical protein CM1200mP39_04640 [Dehalococcoidia bacterium]